MAVFQRCRRHPFEDADFFLDEFARGLSLQRRVVGHAEHGEGRGMFKHGFKVGGQSIDHRPFALFLSDMDPVMQNRALVDIDKQAFMQSLFGAVIIAQPLLEATDIVEQLDLVVAVGRRMKAGDRQRHVPSREGVVSAFHLFKDGAQVEMRLEEFGIQRDCSE